MVNETPQIKPKTLTSDTILQGVARVTHGIDLDDAATSKAAKKAFFDALVHYQTLPGHAKISRQAIRLWEQGTAPRRKSAFEFLSAFLQWTRAVRQSTGDTWDEKRVSAFNEVRLFLADEAAAHDIQTTATKAARLQALDPLITMTMQGLMRVSNRSEQSEAAAFFRGGRSDNETDQSYYLMYRYSTNNGSVVKSFMVIQKPVRGTRSIYIFNHFVWGGQTFPFMTHVFRECEGFILKLPRSFYFLGYNYSVPVDKRREPELYKRERFNAKWSPSGMGVLSFEYDDIQRAPGLFSGVTMTLAAMGQPILARVAMLHLGTKQLMGRAISDQDVLPSEIPESAVGEDLNKTISHLKELGCKRFGMALEEVIHQTRSESAGPTIASHIIQMIDNRPAWRNQDSADASARGALETFGTARPRD